MTWHRGHRAEPQLSRAVPDSGAQLHPSGLGIPLRGLWRLVHSRHSIRAGWTNTHSDFNALFSEGLSGIAPKGASQIAQLS